ncbi:MAG TPA: hypothetical protein VKB79_07130 [Bryobacteraceae bacterium]|nr:hypothetical protein [Bryobacteraceae bacterium]
MLPASSSTAIAASPAGPENLFDAIGKMLKPEQREYFYQRMLYFRHLRPDDELLRIVEAMGLLALITREGPLAMAAERAQIAEILKSALESMHSLQESSAVWHEQLDDRLSSLPAEIARGVSPSAIAERIAESLRQHFLQSGIPQIADALALVAKKMNETTAEFQRRATALTNGYSSTVKQADSAIADITRNIRQATDYAERSVTSIHTSFFLDYKLSLAVLSSSALVLGLILGYFMNDWLHGVPNQPAPVAAPAAQAAPQSPPQHVRKNGPALNESIR